MALTGWVRDAALGGAIVGAAVLATAAACGHRLGAAVAPINATSHVVWGDQAGGVRRATWRHTLPGLVINLGAAAFWASVYEALFGRRESRAARLLGGPAVAALAYATDYHLVPRRLTPGWELALRKRDVPIVFAAIAAALPVRAMLARR